MTNRRKFIQTSLLATAATPGLIATLPGESTKSKKSLRLVHMTDIHLEPGGPSQKGFVKTLRKINELEEKPVFILNGGDSIFDALERDKSRTQSEWELWHKILSEENRYRIHSCIGNHDIWGWFLKSPQVTKNVKYGKSWAMDIFELDKPYYSFDHSGWHFIVLDTVQPHEKGYKAFVDEEQAAWLRRDLDINKDKNTCVLSHVPVISHAFTFWHGNHPTPSQTEIQHRTLRVMNAGAIKDIFQNHGNVRLCLSGHLHMREKIAYLGINYLCNGAVSGNWWKGVFHEFEPSFAIIDLYEDGRFTHEWVPC